MADDPSIKAVPHWSRSDFHAIQQLLSHSHADQGLRISYGGLQIATVDAPTDSGRTPSKCLCGGLRLATGHQISHGDQLRTSGVALAALSGDPYYSRCPFLAAMFLLVFWILFWGP